MSFYILSIQSYDSSDNTKCNSDESFSSIPFPPGGQSGPMAEVGPEAEQHREALQLLSINLERRWEAIVMQALQWQNRLKRELGEKQVRAPLTVYAPRPSLTEHTHRVTEGRMALRSAG